VGVVGKSRRIPLHFGTRREVTGASGERKEWVIGEEQSKQGKGIDVERV
jgi:hypothetical protein